MKDLKTFLDQKVTFYQQPQFIVSDPIQIPHQFQQKEDIEIAGFIAALLAWGQRPIIIKKSNQIVTWMNHSPHTFLTQSSEHEFQRFQHFVYRTFNADDLLFLLQALRTIYREHGGLEEALSKKPENMAENIENFRTLLLQTPHLPRSQKHLASPKKGSAAKRINMFLRWMVRDASSGVDFGLWTRIKPSQLMIPLDLHSGRVARKLGLLSRPTDDWKSVEELTQNLRQLDALDPIKYDFALFGMGVSGDLELPIG